MTERPLVSVVLPVYNREVLVRRAIDSVLAQSMADFELLVIDDCSTDATAEVVEEYSSDPRVLLHRNPKNLGPAGARNRGIELGRGRYVAFQDSDDRWFPEKLARQIEALEENPDRRACYCGSLYFAEGQCYYIPIVREGEPRAETATDGDLSGAVLFSNPITPQALLAERTLLDEIGGFDPTLRINEDWELAIRMAQKTRFAFVAEPMAVIYRTPNSVSSDLAADTAVRKRFLTEHAALFAKHPTSRALQNYIVGGQNLRIRAYKDALLHFRQSYRDVPSFRCLLQIQRARLLALVHSQS